MLSVFCRLSLYTFLVDLNVIYVYDLTYFLYYNNKNCYCNLLNCGFKAAWWLSGLHVSLIPAANRVPVVGLVDVCVWSLHDLRVLGGFLLVSFHSPKTSRLIGVS